ncbi:MAG TPA: helix-turn-helix domain-containing protein [Nitrosopumilaceae archaeon]
MLIEIPDPGIIIGFVAAFFLGLLGLYAFYKIKTFIKNQKKFEPSSNDRLEFYERQLIDMKIRLDSLEIDEYGTKSVEDVGFSKFEEKISDSEESSIIKPKYVAPKPRQTPNNDFSNIVDFVLGLITHKSMTSRDIQNASHRSREHISRLMKKLYQEGYVERNTRTKPFTYSITDKGKAKIGILEHLQNVAA